MYKKVWMVMVSILMAQALMKADLPVIEICIRSGNQTQPDIDGDMVVWQDSDNHTYYKLFADPNDPNMIPGSGQQQYPCISGDIVVWYDVHTFTVNQRDIYGYNLGSQTNLFFTSNDGVTQKNPAVSGDYVLWQDLTNGNNDITMYDLSSETLEFICTDTASQLNPAVSDEIAVWQDLREDGYSDSDIYMCDLTAGLPCSGTPVSPADAPQFYPAVSGDLIAWEETASGSAKLVVYDIAQSKRIWEHTITTGINAYCDIYHHTVTGERMIVWQQGTSVNSDIFACDLNTGAVIEIVAGISNDEYPAISGRRIVWQRNGTDIYGAEIPTPTTIRVDAPATGQMLLAGSAYEINWSLDSGTAPDYVNLEYSTNNGIDRQSIAQDVLFADGAYVWSPVADVDSQQCLIFLTDADDSSTGGMSGTFTIFQCDPTLTADLTGDCFVDIADMAELSAQWLSCGNPYDAQWCTE